MKKHDCLLLACVGISLLANACQDDVISVSTLICNPMDIKCESDILKTCLGTSWREIPCPSRCHDAYSCELDEGQICVAGHVRCNNGHTGIVRCSEDGMRETEDLCPNNEVCDASGGTIKCSNPQDVVECNLDQKKCSEDKKGLISCQESRQWGDAVACGEKKHCDDSGSVAQCVPDQEEEGCTPNAVKCSADKKGLISCQESRQWGDAVACGENKHCDDSGSVAQCVPDNPSVDCALSDFKCSDTGDAYARCGETGWGDFEQCPQGLVCDEDAKDCVEPPSEVCKDGAVQCSKDLLESQVCKGGEWTTKEFCPDVALCDEGECKKTVCRPGEPFCGGSGRSTGMYECTPSGQMGAVISYCQTAMGCNADHTACYECVDGKVQCTEDGVFRGCVEGFWKDLEVCGHKDSCTAEAKEPGCTCKYAGEMLSVEPSIRCDADDAKLEVCVKKTLNGSTYIGWDVRQDCGGKDKCASESKTPYCKCENEKYICTANTLQACKDGKLVDVQACSDNEKCDAENRMCQCIDGRHECQEGASVLCKSGEWDTENGKVCGRKPCNDYVGGFCIPRNAVCQTDNETACMGNTLMMCVNGLYEPVQTCSAHCVVESVGSAACSLQCTPEYLSCSSDHAYIRACNNDGLTTTDKPCPPDHRCVAMNGKSAECQPKICDEGTYKCSGLTVQEQTVQICYQNKWIDLVTCEDYGMQCSGGACVPKDSI